jgi:DNA-binding MarR family transcriptional regulator
VGGLKQEIAQRRPFASLEQEALLNLMRAADRINRAMQQRIRPWGVTATQYNVLRILRGSHPDGLTCTAIGERMITAEPDITRLLSRLKGLKLVRQQRDRRDRRQVCTHISEAGLKLLAQMDAMIERAPQEVLGHLSGAELKQFIRLLEIAARAGKAECEGGPVRNAQESSGQPPLRRSRPG